MTVKVKINHAGREYLHWPVSGLPAGFTGNMEILFPPATAWVAMVWVINTGGVWSVWNGATGLPTHARVLVAGPDAPAGADVVLTAGSSTLPDLRLASAPEIIVRTSPAIIVVSSA